MIPPKLAAYFLSVVFLLNLLILYSTAAQNKIDYEVFENILSKNMDKFDQIFNILTCFEKMKRNYNFVSDNLFLERLKRELEQGNIPDWFQI